MPCLQLHVLNLFIIKQALQFINAPLHLLLLHNHKTGSLAPLPQMFFVASQLVQSLGVVHLDWCVNRRGIIFPMIKPLLHLFVCINSIVCY